MKSLKTIIIGGIILVALIVACVVVMTIPDNSDAQIEETSTSEASSESYYVIDADYNALSGFTVVPTKRKVTDETSYSYASEKLEVKIIKEVDEEGATSFSYEASPDPGKFEYNTSMFRSMMYTLTSITATNLVEENVKDLSVYGLDDPTAVIETYYDDGSQIDIIIGSEAPVDGEYYCTTSASANVYTIGSYVDSLLKRRPIEYRDIALFPAYTEDDIYTNINYVHITDYDGNVIEILKDEAQENEYNTEKSLYVMLEPYKVSGNTTTIQTNILDVVSTITLGSIVKDLEEDELKEYGLDKPARLHMTDVTGNEIKLLIGDSCPNPDYKYCMIEDTNTLITVGSSAFACIGTSYVQYMLRTIWTYSIERLQSIDIDIGDVHHDIDVTHYIKQNANGSDVDGVQGTLNGVEIDELNIRRLFIKCLYFRIMGNLTEEDKKTIEDVDPIASIRLNLDEDESHLLEIIPLTDRKYALRVDGEVEYYCYKQSLTSLETAIQYVEDGDLLEFTVS